MSNYLDLTVLRNVAVVALVTGVGITVLFSVAVRALTTADEHPDHSVAVPRLLAAGCLLIVTAAIAVGLWAVLAK
jgi:protein-S-isoprenylcysteine O-methyltransferase Ste14